MKFIIKLFLLILIFFKISTVKAQSGASSQTFYFGTKLKDQKGIVVKSAVPYSDNVGFGFDFKSEMNVVMERKSLSAQNSVYFSVKLPEGNYIIETVTGGDKAAVTTVKAESRRLMVKELKTLKNETRSMRFAVNVRTPKIDDNNNVLLKSRENTFLNWDNKFTLEFLGSPQIQSIKITPAENIKTIYLAGDSTVTDQDLEPWASWGQYFTNYFTTDIAIANYAASGLALSSFKSGKRLEKILNVIKPGDYLFIEFGHNDEKAKGEGNGAWGSYTNLLKEYVIKAREKGGIPVLLTPTQRRHFNDDGTLKQTHGEFPDAMRKVAEELQVPLIDLTKLTTLMYESWGDEVSKKAFVQYPANTFPGQTKSLADNTHFNSFGSNEIAKCVVREIKNLRLEIAQYIITGTPFYDPKKPDNPNQWTLPMSPRFEIAKPDGN